MLFEHFNGKVKVTSYFLGIKEIYAITENTKRFGLIYSNYPYPDKKDLLLNVNTELNEQLLSASHGTTMYYNLDTPETTVEHHNDVEREVFLKYVEPVQEFMFGQFKMLISSLQNLCYDDQAMDDILTTYTIRMGIFAKKRKIEHMVKLSEGFFTNVGDFNMGLVIGGDMKKFNFAKMGLLFLINPEKVFSYFLRLNYFYLKNKYYLSYFIPSYLVYWYIRLNLYLRDRVVSKRFKLKYSFIK